MTADDVTLPDGYPCDITELALLVELEATPVTVLDPSAPFMLRLSEWPL